MSVTYDTGEGWGRRIVFEGTPGPENFYPRMEFSLSSVVYGGGVMLSLGTGVPIPHILGDLPFWEKFARAILDLFKLDQFAKQDTVVGNDQHVLFSPISTVNVYHPELVFMSSKACPGSVTLMVRKPTSAIHLIGDKEFWQRVATAVSDLFEEVKKQ